MIQFRGSDTPGCLEGAQAVRGGSTDTVRPVPQSRGDLEGQDL